MLRRELLITFCLALAACPAPYKPYCHVDGASQISPISDANVALRPRAQLALLSVEQPFLPDGGAGQRLGHAQLFDRAGALVSDGMVDLPQPSGFLDAFSLGSFVDTVDGFAVLTTTRDRSARPDGGADIFARRSVELRRADGGVQSVEIADGGCVEKCAVCLCEPLGVTQLSRVGDNVLVDDQSAGFSFLGERTLRVITPDATLLPKVLSPSSGQLVAGVDALALYPGPSLYSAQLEAISTPPDPPRPDGLGVAWSLADEELITAHLEEYDLLLDRYDFQGARSLGPVRVSDAYELVAAARSAHGVGVLFHAYRYLPDGGYETPLWFAFVDRDGHKRGPDVEIPGGQAGLISASSEDDHFAIFTPGFDGVSRVEVVCE